MANPYSSLQDCFNGGSVQNVDDIRRKFISPHAKQVNQTVEDQQWNFAAKKLAFEDQLRTKAGNPQGSIKGTANLDTVSSKPVAFQIGKPAGAGQNKAPKETSLSRKHKQKGFTYAQTEMVNSMIDKLFSLDSKSSKVPAHSQKGLLSHPSSLNSSNSTSGSQTPNASSTCGSDKRFKTLPPAESLSRNETLGGYIFVCNNETMQEDLKRQLFGLPQRYRDSVRAIQPGLPLFLYNYTTHQLHGIFEAASFGGSNIDPTAWEDKKNKGESRFPAQVRIRVRRICKPLDEDSFRPILYHYDGPKFRLQLTVPETLALLDLLMGNGP